MRTTLNLGLTGPDLLELSRRALAALLPDAGTPSSVTLGPKKVKATPDWLEKWTPDLKSYVMAKWEGRGSLFLDPEEVVKVEVKGYDLDPRRLLNVLAELPFDACSAEPLQIEWFGALRPRYEARGFGGLHYSHGWGCAFRGAGHDRLVSRRWLDHGPWRLLRGANDTSLVQFHDLDADAEAALAQARPGHARMGASDAGGYIQRPYTYSHDLKGLYYASERKMIVAIPYGERVTERRMLDACAARFYQALGPERPLDNVVYSYVDDEVAREQLRELWLRGLECRSFVEGVERRLDDGYQPPPPGKPEWVVRLEEKEGGATPSS